jgi:hypothetical protein
MTSVPIVCVDLNGVLDAYTGWKGPSHFDPPRPGARAFLEALRARGFDVVIFTTRYEADVWAWARAHRLDDLIAAVTDRKPPAHVFVDDRAVCFRGDFEATLRDIDRFSAHWEERRASDDIAPTGG